MCRRNPRKRVSYYSGTLSAFSFPLSRVTNRNLLSAKTSVSSFSFSEPVRNGECGLRLDAGRRRLFCRASARSRFRLPHSVPRIQMVRLQKFLADAGVASRRAGEQMILAGRVAVNGETVRRWAPGLIRSTTGWRWMAKPVRAKRKLYVALNKPPGWFARAGMSMSDRRFTGCCRRNGATCTRWGGWITRARG